MDILCEFRQPTSRYEQEKREDLDRRKRDRITGHSVPHTEVEV